MSRTPLAVCCVALLLLATVPAPVAADSRTGGSVVVESGETVSDLTVTAGTIVVRGTVEGDLEAYGGRVVVAEGGRVTGRLRATAGTVVVNGTVEGTVLAYGGSILLGETGRVERSLGGAAGSVRVDGVVLGDVTVLAGTVTLGETADVRGDLNYDGRLVDEGGTVRGEIRESGDLGLVPSVPIPGLVLSAYWFLANAALGAFLLVAFPRFSWAAANTIAVEPLRTTAAGLLGLVGGLLVVALALLTVVGIPLGLAAAAVLFVCCWAGAVLGRFAVGSWLLSFVDRDDKWPSLVVGLLLVGVLVRLPVVGDAFRAVVLLAGLGTVVLGLRSAYEVLRDHPGGLTSL